MKHLIAIILLSVVCAIPACAQDDDKPKAQWEVKIDITYNAVSRQEAEKIASRFMAENGTACKAETRIKKVDGVGAFDLSGWSADRMLGTTTCYDNRTDAARRCSGGYTDTATQPGRYCCN